MKLSRPLLAVSIIVISAIGLEFGVRSTGIIDFPLYDADEEIGYVLKPSQSGRFLNKNSWTVNAESINAGPWKPNGKKDILLVGDSLVWGGNPMDQSERLGPQLEKLIPNWRVWPIAAGSWSAGNQLVYFSRHPDVLVQGDIIVWVLNDGDLAEKSEWTRESTHPRTRPTSALAYAFEKYVKPRLTQMLPAEKQTEPVEGVINQFLDDETIDRFSKFVENEATSRGVRFLFIAYPGKGVVEGNQTDVETYAHFVKRLRESVGVNGQVFDLKTSTSWNADLYRDGIHPNAEGNRIMAAEIAKLLNLQ